MRAAAHELYLSVGAGKQRALHVLLSAFCAALGIMSCRYTDFARSMCDRGATGTNEQRLKTIQPMFGPPPDKPLDREIVGARKKARQREIETDIEAYTSYKG